MGIVADAMNANAAAAGREHADAQAERRIAAAWATLRAWLDDAADPKDEHDRAAWEAFERLEGEYK